jgi:hypothetical protein
MVPTNRTLVPTRTDPEDDTLAAWQRTRIAKPEQGTCLAESPGAGPSLVSVLSK